MLWTGSEPGVVTFPSGRCVRGRAFRKLPAEPADWTLWLGLLAPADPVVETRCVRWPDFWVPLNPRDAHSALRETYERTVFQRVEVTCGGGVGRTGTAIASLAILDGLSAEDALSWTRAAYHRRAVETPGQRRWLSRVQAQR